MIRYITEMRWEFSIFCVLDNIMGNTDNWREHIKWMNTDAQGLPCVTTVQDDHVKYANGRKDKDHLQIDVVIYS
jgi:hypothetical protein